MGTGEELERLFLHWLIRMEGMGAVTVKRIGVSVLAVPQPAGVCGDDPPDPGDLRQFSAGILYRRNGTSKSGDLKDRGKLHTV